MNTANWAVNDATTQLLAGISTSIWRRFCLAGFGSPQNKHPAPCRRSPATWLVSRGLSDIAAIRPAQ